MPQQTSITEAHLQSLTPSAITPDFLDRLVACADNTLATSQPGDTAIEDSLRSMKARHLPGDQIEKLATLIGDTPFAVDHKIVLFNRKGPRSKNQNQRPPALRYAAAAAVAIIGAAAALISPPPTTNQTAQTRQPALQTSAITTPASFNRDLRETRDEGVIWRSPNQPHRVLRLTFTDTISLTKQTGETIEVRKPRVEYLIVPEKID